MKRAPHPDAGYHWKFWQRDLLASLVVFLVAMPLCMGVAVASGAPVSRGLITGIVGGLLVGLIAGSPLQVSGPAAGLTVVVYQLIQTLGIEKLGVCVLVAGLLQVVAGYFKLGQWFRAVSPAVIQGMLAGIGILIFAGQFHVMVDDKPHETGLENLLTIPQAIAKSFPPPKLGSAEDRAEETKELRLLGALHLQQEELREEIHYLLSEVSKETSPKKQDAASESLSVRLRGLAERQKSVVTELASFQNRRGNGSFAKASEAAQAALVDIEQGDIYESKGSQDVAELAVKDFLSSRKNHGWAALLGIGTIALILAWKIVGQGRLKLIPAPLVAVVAMAALATLISVPVLYVEIPDNIAQEIYFPKLADFAALTQWTVWVFVMQLAVIASAETLLCASAVDRIHQGPRTDYDRELTAQGFGNMLCGFLCALPMTGVIVRSSANVQAGAKTRWSAVLHGAWILLFVSALAWLLRNVPMSALAGILVYTGFKLVDYKAVKLLAKRGRGELAIYLATVGTIVVTDLLKGVIVGIVLSVIKLLYVFTRLEVEVEPARDPHRRVIHLRGSATFLKVPVLAEVIEQLPPDVELHVDVEHLDYIDAACLDLFEHWEEQNADKGAHLVIDAESLQARFWRRKQPILAPSENGHAATAGVVSPRRKQQPI